MHISTKAISVFLFSFIGGSKAAHAVPYEDAYGVTYYGFQCEDRVYTKPVIFAAAKNLCDKIPGQSNLRFPNYSRDGYRGAFGYDAQINIDNFELIGNFYTYTPIFVDGTLFPLESNSPKQSKSENFRMDPGPDRLLVGTNCNIMGAITDLDYRIDTDKAKTKACRILNSKEDAKYFVQSPGRSPQRSREQTPE